MVEVAAVRRELVGFGFGEGFGQVAILLGDFRGSILGGSIDRGQKLGERGDGIEVENVELVMRPDFAS